LATKVNRNSYENFEPYYLFELYYVIYKLISIGIIPRDVHGGNIELLKTNKPESFNVKNSIIEFEPGYHVRLIDYAAYESISNYRTDIKILHEKIISVIFYLQFDGTIDSNQFNPKTKLIYNEIMKKGDSNPQDVLLKIFDMLK